MMVRLDDDADNSVRKAGRVEGRRRKDAAHAIHEARRERHLVEARRVLLLVLLDRGKASADDWRDAVTLPEGIDPVVFGAVPKPFAIAGIIRRAGFVTTSRPEAHARPLSLWELIDRPAAERWLVDHPKPSAVDDSTPPQAIETADASAQGLEPVDTVAVTSLGTLTSDFSRNDRPDDSVSPDEQSAARVQRSLFDDDNPQRGNHAA